MSESVQKKPSEPSDGHRFMYQEYWVDFLGGLLPGTLFSLVGLYILIPAFLLFVSSISRAPSTGVISIIIKLISSTKDTPNMIWIAASIILVAVSYILGHVFYRQDPNEPNQRSLKRISTKFSRNNNQQECEPDDMKNEFGCSSINECEFPYKYFKQYLKYRGLDYLADLAVWCEDESFRTKNYISILKARIRFYYPNHCSTIIRNEAHIRLAISVWYVGKALLKASLAAALLLLIAFFIYNIYIIKQLPIAMPGTLISHYIVAMFTIFTGGFLGYYIKRHVESFLHYQRQREIVHVLEISWTAFVDNPDLLRPPFNEYTRENIDTYRAKKGNKQ